MIITIGGKAGSGKSSVAKLVAKKLGFKHYSSGEFMREMAKERGISLMAISKLAETDKSIDEELDNRQIELGKKEDNFVIDGRLSAHFIPHAKHKIFLDADSEVRAERVLKEGRDDEHYPDLDQTIKEIKDREESENKRYKEYYDYDCYDPKHFTLIIDTTDIDIDEVVSKIMDNIK